MAGGLNVGPMKYEMKKFGDGDCRRIENESGEVVALVARMSNTFWCLLDTNGNRLPIQTGVTDKAAFKKWLACREAS